ncbi:MAG: M48 family metallopeptidase [bacterium]|nr:M48 family metallopeptidase [bacterium]
MAIKIIEIEGVGSVSFQKRKGTRSLKLHIRGNCVKVTMPNWYPYAQAKQYVLQKKSWILEHKKETNVLTHGTFIGKQHKIAVVSGESNRTIVKNGQIKLTIANDHTIESENVQKKLVKACERALALESNTLLVSRVNDISIENDIGYNSVKFKKLQSRWGSCDHHNNLVFNIYLLQLPWKLIDYVIVHELAHTIQHNHSRAFWDEVAKILPDHKNLRKEVATYDTQVVVM